MSDASPDIRVSDAERQRVVDRLRDETSAGRLTLDEFDERVGEALAAKTRAQLIHAMRELPDVAVDIVPSAPVAVDDDVEQLARRRHWGKVRNDLAGAVSANGICIGIWVVTGADGHFWPIWVLIPTLFGVVEQFLRGPERERQAIEQERKRSKITFEH